MSTANLYAHRTGDEAAARPGAAPEPLPVPGEEAPRFLIVSWYFPPANTVAAIRLGKMARHLERAGYDLRVITPDLAASDRSLAVEIEPGRIQRTRYLDLDQRFNPSPRSSPPAKPERDHPSLVRSMLIRLRRLFGHLYRNVILYPDRRIDWLFTLLPALARALKGADRPALILVSGPPFSPIIAVAAAAWWYGTPWMVEFRDRWVDDPYAQIPRWRLAIDRWLERFLVRRAAGVITVSDLWSAFYGDKYGLPTETVMNGFDPADFTHEGEPASGLPLRILHAGTIYPGRRDPQALLLALRDHGFSPDEVKVVFYGQVLEPIREQAAALGVTDFVEIEGAVPYQQAIRLQRAADVLLLMQWNDPADEGNVPAKLFEYFATGRQILGLGPENGVPARLVRERQAGAYCNDPAGIAALLRGWLEQKRASGRVADPPAEAAQGLERDAQYRRLDRFCRKVLADDCFARAENKAAPLRAVLSSPEFKAVDQRLAERPVVCVVIDAEADFNWERRFSRDQHSTASMAAQAKAQVLFDRFGTKPTYLIDYPVATDPAAAAILRDFVARGTADVGLQLHPWTTPPFDELLSTRNSFPSNLPKALQRAKIEVLQETVRRTIGVEPRVFKAGRYGFNDDTAELLEDFGLEVDTSVVPFTDFGPGFGPNFYAAPPGPFWFGRTRPLLELPVTRDLCGVFGASLGPPLLPLIQGALGRRLHLPGILARTRLLDRLTLTPEGIALEELKYLTTTLMARGQRIFSFVFHSPSLAPGNTPYVRSEAELQVFLARIEGYLRFFTEELGGVGMSAIEVRDLLLDSRAPAAGRAA